MFIDEKIFQVTDGSVERLDVVILLVLSAPQMAILPWSRKWRLSIRQSRLGRICRRDRRDNRCRETTLAKHGVPVSRPAIILSQLFFVLT